MLIVARHGRSEANAAGLLSGRGDARLDDVGRAQAAAMRDAIGACDRIHASPLSRARETAEIIAGDDVEVRTDDRLLEIDYGDLDGTPMRDIDRDLWTRWRDDIAMRLPDGESLLDVAMRVEGFLEEIRDDAEEGRVLIVSHVTPIKVALAWVLGAGVEISWRCFLAPGSLMRVALDGGAPSLLSFNETAHLPE